MAEITLIEPVTVVTTETETIKKVKKSGKADKKIMLDTDVDPSEWARYRTPGALQRTVDDGDKLFRSARKKITSKKVKFDKFGRIDVEGVVAGKSLQLKIQITCNPEYMCAPHDLVPVMMETRTDKFAFTIALVQPTPQENFFEIDVEYDLRDLAVALGVDLGKNIDPLAAIQAKYPELGVKAQWLADTTGGGNQANHVGGGMFEKGGSGRIMLRPRTEKDFTDTYGVRNLEWNMCERLTRGRARPVYLAFDDILAEGKELATTIEAESEFMCSPTELMHVIKTMDALVETVSKVDSLDLTKSMPSKERDAIKFLCPTMVEMTKEVKEYVDTYYDIEVSGSICPLLNNRIVLRRRHVGTDPAGTFLFTLKGGTCTFGDEVLRYAAQINLIKDLAITPKGMLRVRDLMCDTVNEDNAFAVCFQQALTDRGLLALIGAKDTWTLTPKFTVTSTRHKYSMKFADNTVLDFSADTAIGTISGQPGAATVCSFELGVGHPGLATAGTTTFMSMDAQIALWDQKGYYSQRGKEVKPLITRPYHIWKDVCNDKVLQKSDFMFYALVRKLLLNDHFAFTLSTLERGGNKGSVLAGMLGLLK
jgi:hypothetical protein